MTSKHLVDPAYAPLLEMPPITIDPETLPGVREVIVELYRAMAPERGAPRTAMAPGRDGAPDVHLRIYAPAGAQGKKPAVYYIHGGGFVLGTAAMVDNLCWRMADEQDAVVVAVDYRLAPEASFPGPLEDCYAGLAWLFANGESLGADLSRVVVMGDSAGGGLAAALSLLARDRGEYKLSAQLLLYPMLDHRAGGEADVYGNPLTGEFSWTRQANRFSWAAMQGDYDMRDDRLGYFSPARATNLAGLPPTFIGVGSLDLFLDEDMNFAGRLARAGVPVECHVYPGAIHACERLLPDAPISRQMTDDERRALAKFLKG